jgi:thiol-disulfide isomerase/thioredoxin
VSAARPILAAVALAALLAACDERATPPPVVSDRSNAVLAGDAGASHAASTPTPVKTAPAAPRKLCSGAAPGTKSPKPSVPTRAAPGVASPPASIPFGVGRWTWVNVWAAWCEPCKQEMPRLIAWQDKLRAAGALVDVAFVSIDDDERQLQRFLEQQPAGGLKSTYFLGEGGARKDFLAALGAKETAELPMQAFYAPSGQLSCFVQGAIEESDYAAIAAMVGAKR